LDQQQQRRGEEREIGRARLLDRNPLGHRPVIILRSLMPKTCFN
jgi:hypothetical protein